MGRGALMATWRLACLGAVPALLASAFLVACGAGPQPKPPPAPGAPIPAPRVIAGDLDAHVLLGDLPLRAQHFGAGPVSVVAASEAVEGERLGAFVEIPREMCLLVYARASSSIDDLDVAAFADEGSPIAADEAPDPHPTILFCPPHPDRVYVSAHAATGEGLVALAVQLVPRERASDVGRAVGARGALGQGGRPAEAWPGLDDHVRAHRQELGGKWEEFRKVAVSVDARAPSFVAFPLEADQCTDAVIVPDDDVALLDVEALDDRGRVLARARDGSRDRTLTVCSPISFSGSLSIRPHVGQGLAAVVLGRARGDVARDLSVRPDIAWSASTQSLDSAKTARNAELAKVGYAAPWQAVSGALVIGRRTTVPVDFGHGVGCSRVDVVGGAPTALVDGAIWDDAGSLVGSGEGVASVTFFACAKGKARLDLEARGRPGPFLALVRHEPWQNAVFSQHPLAAARMLSRAAMGASAMLEGAAATVRSVELEATRLVSFEENVAPGKCLRVAAGAEGEGTGVDLRIFDRASSDELDRSHGERAAGVRACAPEGAQRTVRIEIRASSGKLDAIVGERVTP